MWSLWAALIGCGCETPLVSGGTRSQRESVEDVLDGFFEVSLPVQVCGVRIVAGLDLPRVGRDPVVDGLYDRTTRRIQLSAEPRSRTLEAAARHELCHALDLQHGLSAGSTIWPLDPTDARFEGLPPGRWDEEGFAAWCELGAEALVLSAREEAATLVREGFPSLSAGAVPLRRGEAVGWWAEQGSWVVGEGVWPREDGAFEISIGGATGPWDGRVALDARRCEEVAVTGEWRLEPVDATAPPGWGVGRSSVWLSSGAQLTWGRLDLPDGSTDRPWLVYDGAWHPGDDRQPGGWVRGVLEVDGAPWGVEAVGTQVRCFPWVEGR